MRFSMILSLVLVVLAGCSKGLQPGQLELGLVSAGSAQTYSLKQPAGANDVAQAIVVVERIDARIGATWLELSHARQPIDLLALDPKAITSLGVIQLPSGRVDELKLTLDEQRNYVVLGSGKTRPLAVPSQGVLPVKGKIQMNACASGVATLAFDPKLSEKADGESKAYAVAPAITLKTLETEGTCDPSEGADGGSSGGGGGEVCGDTTCLPTESCVNDQCVPTDPCAGVLCDDGLVCDNGACVPDPCASCTDGQSCVDGACVDNPGGGGDDGSCDSGGGGSCDNGGGGGGGGGGSCDNGGGHGSSCSSNGSGCQK